MNIQRFVVIEENTSGVSNPNKGLEVEASVLVKIVISFYLLY